MNILVLGNGGREHAIIKALSKDPTVNSIACAPGNAGIAQDVDTYPVSATDKDGVLELAAQLQPDLIVIGPEAPLVEGVSDALTKVGFTVFGPSAQAAQLEGSKAFAKDVMEAAGIPTAQAFSCATVQEAKHALNTFGTPYVVKDDGLAAGKGVVVTEDYAAAVDHAEFCFGNGGTVVIEEYLDGPEVSLFVICDGKTAVPLQAAQDFKRAYDNDRGPNTGGMGAYTPLDWLPEGFTEDVVTRVAQPCVDEMARRGTPFVGVLYCGLAIGKKGIKVVEFNARFGDPETQVVLSVLETPLAQLLLAAARGELKAGMQLEFSSDYAVDVVLASGKYPAGADTGHAIHGLERAAQFVDVIHAGTSLDKKGNIINSGGRVLACVGQNSTLADARKAAYFGIECIGLDHSFYRTDIALKAEEGKITL